VTYTNLSAGEYTFKLYAENRLTGSKTDVRYITIIITPPWWLSSTAITIYASLIILIIFLIIRSTIRRRQIQKIIAQSE
ncbi:triple tyrosine motif-containing protein, partial [Psychrobacter sp. TB55-MNA-CIBAN-0194]